MRIGLIAALKRSDEGARRANLLLAGRSVIGWQAALLQELGAERVLCLTDRTPASGEILALQHALEAGGCDFHALTGFAALAALVRAEDDLVIIQDGLVPGTDMAKSLFNAGPALRRGVATLAADHPLAAAYPDDFERIDAARHWAGVLVMRGAAVQQIADFPADCDAISLLLRLALQAGTPCRDLGARELVTEQWLLASDLQTVDHYQAGLMARLAPPADGCAPFHALAGMLARDLVTRGLEQGGKVAAGAGLIVLLAAITVAVFGFPAIGLGLAALGAFGAQVSLARLALVSRLQNRLSPAPSAKRLGGVTDGLVGVTLWCSLTPDLTGQPLAVLGLLTIGLARLAARMRPAPVGIIASDRVTIALVCCGAASLGVLLEVTACLALGLLTALLLRTSPE
ncbi:hypothetical protein C0V72_03380 [Porphyrobacter sp. TH134]|uniref:hypothetical protein n=1 Tax=Porphyrobacter sp. TH134 TaxID=2067450 RepID=UPI000C7AB3D8|nr:hypothetical protein [Porphyrobacter sp. TH134]PLK25052.1 hypothetical protein C0V72_03380 [Porphyrobacter sp. TH134]